MRKLIIGATVAVALTALSGCVYSTQVADPGVWKFGNGYLVASSDNFAPGTSKPSMPIYSMSSDQLQHSGSAGTRAGQIFLPNQEPGWVDRNQPLWAPEIEYIGGRLVAYYAAGCNGTSLCPKMANGHYSTHRCIGMATAGGIGQSTGFTPVGQPFCTPAGDYDLIDPSVFTDDNGSNYLLFKRDPQAPGTKQIAITRLDGSGLNPALPTKKILSPGQPWETTGTYTSVEAPTMIRRGDLYYLFYSGSLYKSTRYGVGVARCRVSQVGYTPMGCDFNSKGYAGWEYTGNPILGGSQHTGGLCGIGHQDVSDNGAVLWYHAYPNSSCSGLRVLGAQRMDWGSDDWPHPVDGGTP